MAKAKTGALVRYCGHHAVFAADIFEVAGANVVRANGPITEKFLDRSQQGWDAATHHVHDFPRNGFWKPELGVFVVPKSQVEEL